MKSLKQLCSVRQRVFDQSRRDTVLDLTDLVDDRINGHEFFATNYVTGGMQTLLREAFDRFTRRSDQGIFLLTQAMGGGKTHNMVALGLLAKHPDLRESILNESFDPNLGRVRVAAFTGRESDARYGIWGAIADQLGKKEQFSEYYSPLSAPGQTAWIELLKGDPLLILLDELPPYFQNARAREIGNADLATVTTTALSNLFVACGKPELDNVCIVVSDLRATYGEGSEHVGEALHNLENEASRSAMQLEPVRQNTTEIYHILRKQIFEEVPPAEVQQEVARAYAKAVKDARQMDVTDASPEKYARQIEEAYPFHFSIRDLYARFRENAGFQQTRDLIRLMRTVVARMWESGRAEKSLLVHPYDLDLNHKDTLAQVTKINPKVENAISHDIASDGTAVAERIDDNRETSDAQDMATLLLMASLSNVPKGVRGLTKSEITSLLCAPDRDVTAIKEQVLKPFFGSAWYLHTDADGRLLFKDVKNITAQLNTTAGGYGRETRIVELRTFLKGIFDPNIKDAYQLVQVMPAVDDIDVKPSKVTLVLARPTGQGLSEELEAFYSDQQYQNRLAFLTGDRVGLDHLLQKAARLKAIRHILQEMKLENIAETDPQFAMAREIEDDIKLQLLSAARETFTRLYFPSFNGLRPADFVMRFEDNNYNAEKQVRDTLESKGKFTSDIDSASFRKKCEDRLFTQQQMPWTEIKHRAATSTKWPWHYPDALDSLKDRMVYEDQWREEGNYVNKGPFPPPQTDVRIQELARDRESGKVTLRLKPVHGDIIHFEVGGEATPASAVVQNPQAFATDELRLSFLCVDTEGEHEAGPPVTWENKITIQHKVVSKPDGTKEVVLEATPKAEIHYTTDGSNPRVAGGTYEGSFEVANETQVVQAVAKRDGIVSELVSIPIDWSDDGTIEVVPDEPAEWSRPHELTTTKEVYDFLKRLKTVDAQVKGIRVDVQSGGQWIDLSFEESVILTSEELQQGIESIRGLLNGADVSLMVQALRFPMGRDLTDWAEETGSELTMEEITQS